MLAMASALIVVGALMMSEIVHIFFDDITEAVTCFFTIVVMPFTYSIVNDFAFGFTSFMPIKLLAGRIREVSPVMVLLGLVFIGIEKNFLLTSLKCKQLVEKCNDCHRGSLQ